MMGCLPSCKRSSSACVRVCVTINNNNNSKNLNIFFSNAAADKPVTCTIGANHKCPVHARGADGRAGTQHLRGGGVVVVCVLGTPAAAVWA